MRFSSLPTAIAAMVLGATAAPAQSPLSTTFAGNNNNAAGGMVFFDLDVSAPAGITITSLDIHTTSPTGGIDCYTTAGTYVGSAANQAAWTLAGTGSYSSAAGTGQATQVCLGAGFYLPPGQHGIALHQHPTTSQIYSVGGAGTPLTYGTNEVTFQAGAASNVPFGGTPYSPRVWNGTIHYNIGPLSGSCAGKTTFGARCDTLFDSFYEELPTAAFDLMNTDIVGTATANGHVVTNNPGTGPLPIGGVDPSGGQVLTLADDSAVGAGQLGMVIGSNGWLARGPGNSWSYAPTAGIMLANPAETIYAWTDLQPNVGGTVTYEENPATGQTRVTFDAVPGWNSQVPATFQIDYHTATGDWTIRFGTVGLTYSQDWLVGYSPAGLSPDPGSTDISATPQIIINATALLPLTIDSNLPQVGANWTVTTTNVDAVSPVAFTFFGTRGPPVPLQALGLQAPNCFVHLSSIAASGSRPNVAGTARLTVPVPNNPALVGQRLSAQSACLTLANGANLHTSNGVEGLIGI